MDDAERTAKIAKIRALLDSPRTTEQERVLLDRQLAQFQPETQEENAADLWKELMADVAARAEARGKVVASNPESEKATVSRGRAADCGCPVATCLARQPQAGG